MMTTAELQEKVDQHMKKAKNADLKWVYCYFTGHDEFPVLTDEVPAPQSQANVLD